MVFRIVTTIAMMLSLSPAVADDWFVVEVIVFQHREDASSDLERFPHDPGAANMTAVAEVVPPTEPLSVREYEQVPANQLRLSDTFRVLGRSSRYQALMHVGWRQIGRPPELSIPVRIHDDVAIPLAVEVLAFETPAIEPSTTEEPRESGLEEHDSFWDAHEDLRSEFAEPPAPQRLAGTVRLSLQRFLHVEVDLTLTSDEPLPFQEEHDWHTQRAVILDDFDSGLISADEARSRLESLSTVPRFLSWRLQESRRVRSGEVHYLDHPRFGVIVTVTPIPAEDIEARGQILEPSSEPTANPDATSREAGSPEP